MNVRVKAVNDRKDSDVALVMPKGVAIMNRAEAETLYAQLEDVLDYR
jgi:hypothetical protein